ncbi:MAG: hypothetical protein EP335_12810 [Alphaproteobacteria bacterium]|nr:MAG: hypothetical protein EP335_12810 [Alphaproteobacteria bacterium]
MAASSDDDTKADEPTAAQTKAEERMAKLMEKYAATGETRNCISLRMIRDSDVIDDQTIFFQVSGNKGYLNKLPRRCPRLGDERRFMHKTSIGQLCDLDFITVLDSTGNEWSSCGLGKFEEMEKKPAPETNAGE